MKFFESFEESWTHFSARKELMENFLDQFPREHVVLAGWLIPVDPALHGGFAAVQEDLAGVSWLRHVPEDWLHVWIGGATWVGTTAEAEGLVERARDALAGVTRFRISYPRLNCFHTAVIAEAESDVPRELAARLFPGRDLSIFLPHVTISVPTEAGPPEYLRDALVPIRDRALGEQEVTAVDLCLVPAGRTTVFNSPWTVAGSVELPGT